MGSTETEKEFTQIIENIMAAKSEQAQKLRKAWRKSDKKLQRKKKAARVARKQNRT